MTVRPGDIVHLGRAASVQFDGDRALRFRIVAVCGQPTYDGWVWLVGYVLDSGGAAVERREVYVQRAGIVPEPAPRTGVAR